METSNWKELDLPNRFLKVAHTDSSHSLFLSLLRTLRVEFFDLLIFIAMLKNLESVSPRAS